MIGGNSFTGGEKTRLSARACQLILHELSTKNLTCHRQHIRIPHRHNFEISRERRKKKLSAVAQQK
jgi:hypothetical protein